MSRSSARPHVAPVPTDPWRRAGSVAAHPSNAALGDEPLVATIARGLAAVAPPWSDAAHPATDGRRYEQLLATEQYDVWLIHWPAGSGLAAHDHGGSSGAFAVVDGVLDEDVTVSGRTSRRRVPAGAGVWFGADHVHAVHNRADRAATSVHVYSPPLGAMSFVATAADDREVA